MSLLSEKLAPIWSAINRLQARQMSIFPATVTSIDPVRIRIDGESQSLAATPDALIPAGPGERVRVLRYGTTHMILGRVGGQGAMLLDAGALPTGTHETNLHIPQHLRGRFSHYEIVMQAAAFTTDGDNVRPVSVWINGDSGNNYRSSATVLNRAGETVSSYLEDGTNFPRTAYVGQASGAARITLIPGSPTSASYVTWHATGWVHNGAASNYTFTTGGRYSGPSGVLAHVNIRTNTPNATWADLPYARLWGYR